MEENIFVQGRMNKIVHSSLMSFEFPATPTGGPLLRAFTLSTAARCQTLFFL